MARTVLAMERYEAGLGRLHRGRRFIVVVDVAVSGVGVVRRLQARGARAVMMIAAHPGMGDVPADIEPFYLDVPAAATVTDAIHGLAAALADPPAALVERVDAFDPDRTAIVRMEPFLSVPTLFGRRVEGGRQPLWAALENKTIIDSVWDEAGVRRARSAVVPVGEAAEAAATFGRDLGTVWSADNTRGWHGAGDRTRWVVGPIEARAAAEFFAPLGRSVRVMPFLDGIPCSIHAVVTGRGSAVGRPVENVILRRVSPRGFVYAGVSRSWDPPEELRQEMRDVARRVAALLDRGVGYRGAFGIDGIATRDGFLPNELNPRMSAGFALLAAEVAGLPLADVANAVADGSLDVDPGHLEDAILAAADGRMTAGFGYPSGVEVAPDEVSILFGGGRVSPVENVDGARDGWIRIGPSRVGSYLLSRLEEHAIVPGASVAPYAVAALGFASARWGLAVPELEPAPDVTG